MLLHIFSISLIKEIILPQNIPASHILPYPGKLGKSSFCPVQAIYSTYTYKAAKSNNKGEGGIGSRSFHIKRGERGGIHYKLLSRFVVFSFVVDIILPDFLQERN